jgi:hypothetical protein
VILISPPPKKKEVMEGYLGGRRLVGKLRDRLVDAVCRPEAWNWKGPARNREGWRKEIGEAVARKWAAAPYN